MSRCDVAIVGGGFSGSMVAVNLAQSGGDLSLRLFEPNELGRGAAYGTTCAAHLLNTRANAMSAFPGDPDHFVRWLGNRAGPETFVPRQLYGSYVADLISRALSRAGFAAVREPVLSVARAGDGYVLRTASGADFTARQVVLATGNASPGADALPAALVTHPGYVADPWRFDYRAISGRVLLVGTGLTALDVLVALERYGHRGPVDAISRRGKFPEVHAEGVAPHGRRPLLAAGTARGLLRGFRGLLRDAAATGSDWRALVDAVRPESEALWRRLAPSEQRRFDRHLRARWERYRHRAPQQVDSVRARYLAAGRLAIHCGRLTEASNGWIVAKSADGSEQELRPDWIFNCTGPARHRGFFERPPLADMVDSGLLCPEPLGLGLRVDDGLRVIGSDGVTGGLWAAGPPARGSRFEATAVPELREMAHTVAEGILGELKTSRLSGRRFLEAEAIL